MFDDDNIDHQGAYEQFHRTRPAPEGKPASRITEATRRNRARGTSPFARDRFEDVFEQNERLW